MISLKDIAEGEEVTISYIDECMPKVPRRQKLMNVFNFECGCLACLSQTDDEIDQSILDKAKPFKERLDRINMLLQAKKYNLVIYYMVNLWPEICDQVCEQKFEEVDLVLSLLFKESGNSHELAFHVNDPMFKRLLLRIGMCCWAQKSPTNTSLAPYLMMEEQMQIEKIWGDDNKY